MTAAAPPRRLHPEAPRSLSSRELIAWSRRADARARRAGRAPWASPAGVAAVAGAGIAAWVAWRASAGAAAGGHAWLAAALVAFAAGALRAPSHLYWRPDAALLAQLPIEGGPLLDAALARCARAAAATTAALLLGAAPLAAQSGAQWARAALLAVVLGVAAALLVPGVAVLAAMLVTAGQRDGRLQRIRAATGIAAAPGPPSTALLGALPGLAATGAIAAALAAAPWLTSGAAPVPPVPLLGGLAIASLAAAALARALAPRAMGEILRDLAALDRQRLATLEISPPTAIERTIARAIGTAALPYAKDARLMRRRYPMAFALGALAWIVLAAVAVIRPAEPVPWLAAALGGAAAYAAALAGRLGRPPIELPRLASTLPTEAGAARRAKVAWLLGWWVTFAGLPGAVAAVRQPDVAPGLALLAAGTAAVVAAAAALSRPPR